MERAVAQHGLERKAKHNEAVGLGDEDRIDGVGAAGCWLRAVAVAAELVDPVTRIARTSRINKMRRPGTSLTDQATLSFSSITIDGLLTATSASTLGQGAILDQPLPNFFGKTGQPGALSLVMQSPARVLSYDGSSYTFWAN